MRRRSRTEEALALSALASVTEEPMNVYTQRTENIPLSICTTLRSINQTLEGILDVLSTQCCPGTAATDETVVLPTNLTLSTGPFYAGANGRLGVTVSNEGPAVTLSIRVYTLATNPRSLYPSDTISFARELTLPTQGASMILFDAPIDPLVPIEVEITANTRTISATVSITFPDAPPQNLFRNADLQVVQ